MNREGKAIAAVAVASIASSIFAYVYSLGEIIFAFIGMVIFVSEFALAAVCVFLGVAGAAPRARNALAITITSLSVIMCLGGVVVVGVMGYDYGYYYYTFSPDMTATLVCSLISTIWLFVASVLICATSRSRAVKGVPVAAVSPAFTAGCAALGISCIVTSFLMSGTTRTTMMYAFAALVSSLYAVAAVISVFGKSTRLYEHIAFLIVSSLTFITVTAMFFIVGFSYYMIALILLSALSIVFYCVIAFSPAGKSVCARLEGAPQPPAPPRPRRALPPYGYGAPVPPYGMPQGQYAPPPYGMPAQPGYGAPVQPQQPVQPPQSVQPQPAPVRPPQPRYEQPQYAQPPQRVRPAQPQNMPPQPPRYAPPVGYMPQPTGEYTNAAPPPAPSVSVPKTGRTDGNENGEDAE